MYVIVCINAVTRMYVPYQVGGFLTEVYKTPRETQMHKQGRCVLLQLLWRRSRDIYNVGL